LFFAWVIERRNAKKRTFRAQDASVRKTDVLRTLLPLTRSRKGSLNGTGGWERFLYRSFREDAPQSDLC